MDLPRYYVVGSWGRPVKVIETGDGGMTIVALDWENGDFKRSLIYGTTLFASTDDVQRVGEARFNGRVIQARNELEPSLPNIFDRRRKLQEAASWDKVDDRMKERMEEYEWHPDRILNYLEGGLVCENFNDISTCLEKVSEKSSIVRVIDRFAFPLEDGYRDILANIKHSNGHIGELRVELRAISEIPP